MSFKNEPEYELHEVLDHEEEIQKEPTGGAGSAKILSQMRF